MKPLSPLKQKILLILATSFVLGFSYSPRQHRGIYKMFFRTWKEINKNTLTNAFQGLYRSKLIKRTRNADGSYTFILTEKGKKKVLTYRFNSMKIQQKKWDKKWRFVCFDIPEKLKSSRNILRAKLRDLGFRELQKSIFIVPFESENEINFVIEYLELRPYVRYGILQSIDNELHFKKRFRLQ